HPVEILCEAEGSAMGLGILRLRTTAREARRRAPLRMTTQSFWMKLGTYSSELCPRTYSSNLFLEQGYLALIVGGAAAGAAGCAYYCQDYQRFEGGAGDEDALGVGALVGWV